MAGGRPKNRTDNPMNPRSRRKHTQSEIRTQQAKSKQSKEQNKAKRAAEEKARAEAKRPASLFFANRSNQPAVETSDTSNAVPTADTDILLHTNNDGASDIADPSSNTTTDGPTTTRKLLHPNLIPLIEMKQPTLLYLTIMYLKQQSIQMI